MIVLFLHNRLVHYQLALLFAKQRDLQNSTYGLYHLNTYMCKEEPLKSAVCILHAPLTLLKLFTAQLIHYKSN